MEVEIRTGSAPLFFMQSSGSAKNLTEGWKVGRGPFVTAGLCVAGGDKLDARLLESENTGTDDSETAKPD